jgi:hypothetical protein
MRRLLVARLQKRSRFVPLGLRDWLSRTGEMAPTTAGSSAELPGVHRHDLRDVRPAHEARPGALPAVASCVSAAWGRVSRTCSAEGGIRCTQWSLRARFTTSSRQRRC